jgi:hypothetical protein
MPSSTAQVEESSLGQEDDGMTIGEDPLINLRLDVVALDVRPLAETIVVYLIIEMADVAHNCVVFHQGHLLSHYDVLITCGCDEYVHRGDDVIESNDLKTFIIKGYIYLDFYTFHACLERTDGINFGDKDT